MKFIPTKLDGVHIIEPNVFPDERGAFIKIFNKNIFAGERVDFSLAESFFTISKKGVIRGMHFQIPPHDHAKIVYVASGKVLDVVLDVRKGSPTYGEHVAVEMSAEKPLMMYISPGHAHGFIALENNTSMVYLQSSVHAPKHDHGVHVHSFGMDWQTENPIISKRDRELPHFKDFDSPFTYKNGHTKPKNKKIKLFDNIDTL